LSDIDADAVIDGGAVYAVGQGGWSPSTCSAGSASGSSTSGIATPWAAGDWLFAVNDKAQLVAAAPMARSAG
jgi:hypothetical protein